MLRKPIFEKPEDQAFYKDLERKTTAKIRKFAEHCKGLSVNEQRELKIDLDLDHALAVIIGRLGHIKENIKDQDLVLDTCDRYGGYNDAKRREMGDWYLRVKSCELTLSQKLNIINNCLATCLFLLRNPKSTLTEEQRNSLQTALTFSKDLHLYPYNDYPYPAGDLLMVLRMVDRVYQITRAGLFENPVASLSTGGLFKPAEEKLNINNEVDAAPMMGPGVSGSAEVDASPLSQEVDAAPAQPVLTTAHYR